MIHVSTVSQLVGHDETDLSERVQSTVSFPEHEFDQGAGVEVPAQEFGVRRVFGQSVDPERVCLHDRLAKRGDLVEEVEMCDRFDIAAGRHSAGCREGVDEVYVFVRAGTSLVEAGEDGVRHGKEL